MNTTMNLMRKTGIFRWLFLIFIAGVAILGFVFAPYKFLWPTANPWDKLAPWAGLFWGCGWLIMFHNLLKETLGILYRLMEDDIRS